MVERSGFLARKGSKGKATAGACRASYLRKSVPGPLKRTVRLIFGQGRGVFAISPYLAGGEGESQ
jgi:hypothetical protein